MTAADAAWIGPTLQAARPRTVGALLRQLRDLDAAEEAFQQACLRAVEHWPVQGPPRDAVAWLVRVGRNAATDDARRRRYLAPMPETEPASGTADDDVDLAMAEHLDAAPFRDDVLRLLFTCCHEALTPAQQLALALRIVCGLSVDAIAGAFLASPSAIEQRITRAKRRIAAAAPGFDPPGAGERERRLPAVAHMVYLLFNEGYAASAGQAHVRRPLCEEAIRLARLLLQLFPGEPEVMGLTALLLLQHARVDARLDAAGEIVLLEDQDRRLWDRRGIAEGRVLVEKALRHGRPGPYQVQAAIAAVHGAAHAAGATDWAEIDRLYAVLEVLLPSPVVRLNHAVALAKLHGPEAALQRLEPLADQLGEYFPYVGAKGALLGQSGRIAEARAILGQALRLARTPAEAQHVRDRLHELDDRS